MEKINGVGIHEDDNIMKFQVSIASIVNTLNKPPISQTVYRDFKSSFFDKRKNNIKRNSISLLKNL